MTDEEKESPVSTDPATEQPNAGNEPEPDSRIEKLAEMRIWRHGFMAIVSAVIVGSILAVSYISGDDIFRPVKPKILHWLPYLTNLAGILLFILNTSRKKREGFELRNYWGDYCFRIAESFAYLFIVLWAWTQATSGVAVRETAAAAVAAMADSTASAGAANTDTTAAGGVTSIMPVGAVGMKLGPNIVGFLVGLFILRVERAMEALGDKFEEMLMAILPRSVRYMSAEERRRQQLKMVYKVDEVATQYEAMRSQIDDPAARTKIDQLVDEARGAAKGENPEKLESSVAELTRTFDDVKKSTGEILVSAEEYLGKVLRAEDKTG